MRKYAETLVNDLGVKKPFKHCGNHMVMHFPLGSARPPYYTTFLDDKTDRWITIENATRSFTYHGNVVCVVNDQTEQFWLSHAGWFTSSTTQAINSYREHFSRLGYKCMTD